MSSIDELLSSAAQCYGCYKSLNELKWIIDYNNYVTKLSQKLKSNPKEIGNQIKKSAHRQSNELDTHIHYKYGYGEQRQSDLCARDLLALSWLKSIAKLEPEKIERELCPMNIVNYSKVKSDEMKKILSRGVPQNDDEWLEAVCLTNIVDIRDLLRLKFGPYIFPIGFADTFQMPYLYDLIDVIEDITRMFPELKKYCSNYSD